MANALYDKGREKFLKGVIDWTNGEDDIRCVLVETGVGVDQYDVDLASDEFLSDIAAAARVDTSADLTSRTTAAGVADAADVTFTAVTGNEVGAVVIYKHNADAAAAALVAYIDSATGLPVTPNGGDITIEWDNTAEKKIFKL